MAKTTHVSLTEAKQHLGELVKRAAYGGERIVLESHGKAIAAITPASDTERGVSKQEAMALYDRMIALSKEIEAESGPQPDSVEVLRKLREERDEQFQGLC